MSDRLFIAEYLQQYYDELNPKDFYREIFPLNELETAQQLVQGKYNAIAVELLPETNDETKVKRYTINDDLAVIDTLLQSENFIIISPISYAGKSRTSANARFIYAIAIDLDGITEQQHITDLFYQIKNGIIPQPTYTVWSGTGLHLYYKLQQPLPCFKNITRQAAALKQGLTKRIWNRYITADYEKPQLQSLFQGFRMVGGITKSGGRTRAFITGEAVDIEYLNSFVDESQKIKEYKYKSKLTLKEAAAKYPDWYESKIINKRPAGTWQNKKDLYNWWLRRLQTEIATGHRYYGIMVLAIYAKKCGVSREELESNAFDLLQRMEELTTDETNHFTREDILAALEMYNDNYITFPIHSIETLTTLPIERNKRNGRKQSIHLRIMRANKAILKEAGLLEKDGRPTKVAAIRQWQQRHPNGTKAECIKDTGISRPTVNKWWQS